MKIREQIANCFKNCRELDSDYRIDVDGTHALIITVQENPDSESDELEYFVELNETSDGTDESCADYNISCPMDNFDAFETEIFSYLENNGVYV